MFLRYALWLAVYILLFFAASFPLAFLFDRLFPKQDFIGTAGSIKRVIFMIIWIAVVTAVIWPIWHKLGDLFLSKKKARFWRFKTSIAFIFGKRKHRIQKMQA